MTIKNELKQKKENAMVYTVKFTGEESTRIKIKEEYEAIPINGLDLFKWCATVGAIIQDADEIDLNKEYIFEYIGTGTYIVTEFKKDDYKYKYCVILPLRTGVAKDLLGNRVFYCIPNDIKVDILDDETKKKIHEIDLNLINFVDPKDIYYSEEDGITNMWLG